MRTCKEYWHLLLIMIFVLVSSVLVAVWTLWAVWRLA
jgi:hypothetical protein